MEVLTLGLFWHNFHDSIKEGDGDRILRMWKHNLLTFKAAKRKNYSIEALNLILQVNHVLSQREAAQVKWCRTVITTGYGGHNISMDLHLEYLNCRLKITNNLSYRYYFTIKSSFHSAFHLVKYTH